MDGTTGHQKGRNWGAIAQRGRARFAVMGGGRVGQGGHQGGA